MFDEARRLHKELIEPGGEDGGDFSNRRSVNNLLGAIQFEEGDLDACRATYEATPEKIAKVDGFVSQTGEDAALRKATYEESEGWYAGITADMFS